MKFVQNNCVMYKRKLTQIILKNVGAEQTTIRIQDRLFDCSLLIFRTSRQQNCSAGLKPISPAGQQCHYDLHFVRLYHSDVNVPVPLALLVHSGILGSGSHESLDNQASIKFEGGGISFHSQFWNMFNIRASFVYTDLVSKATWPSWLCDGNTLYEF